MAPMPKRSPFVRSCLLAAAALQLSVPAAAALADAQLDGAATGPAHIESHSTPACARIHPPDCVFHRLLSTPVSAGRPVALGLRFDTQRMPVLVAGQARHRGHQPPLPDSPSAPSISTTPPPRSP